MKSNYRVSINGWSTFHETREQAMEAAMKADEDSAVRVYSRFNNVIWEN